MSSKHKITQNDLRKFMSLHKQKKLLDPSKKIESPLAKYLPDGTLKCILCDTVVRNEAVWTVHINAKLHKENITKRKQGVIATQERLPPDRISQKLLEKNKSVEYKEEDSTPDSLPAKRSLVQDESRTVKKLKGILKNGTTTPALPPGFYDTPANVPPTFSAPSFKPPVEEKKEAPSSQIKSEIKAEEPEDVEMETSEPLPSTSTDSDLPEGFFDNPILDAKARHVEYKDPVEEEWERFQKEMKEEVTLSAQIIQDESEVATVERQIIEVDEQLKNWSRVLDMEKKKETLHTTMSLAQDVKKEDENNSSGGEDLEEFVSWRTKKSFR